MSDKRRFVLFTGQDIGFDLVERFAQQDDLEFIVIADRTDRDEIYGYRSALDAAAERGIPAVQASGMNRGVIEKVGGFRPELVVGAYFPHFISRSVLDSAPMGGINVHPGILPRYRGKFPTPWYILNGEGEFGVAIHRIDEGIDTGDVLVQRTWPMPAEITGHDLYRETMRRSAELLDENLRQILDGELESVPQTGAGSYYSRIEKRYQIDWNSSAEVVERRVRVHAPPYLPAFTYLLNTAVFVERATPVSIEGWTAQGGGRIESVDDQGRPIVSCSDGCLRLDRFRTFPELSERDHDLHFRTGARFD